MIKFTARGYNFEIPYNYILEKLKEGTLLRNLALIPENLVEKIDGCVFVDLNPVHIKHILSYSYNNGSMHKINKEQINNELYRELCYALIVDDNISDWLSVPLSENISDIKDYVENFLEPCKKIITIHTSDNKCIKLLHSVIASWKKCLFRDIISGESKIYFLSENDDSLNVWIDANYKLCNQIISIMRDGINSYHEMLGNHVFKKYILYYGLYSEKELNALTNRVLRITNMVNNVKKYERPINVYDVIDIQNSIAHCFDKKTKNTGQYIEIVDDWREGTDTRGKFHKITDLDFNNYMDVIKKNKMTFTKRERTVDYRDSYNEKKWEYTLSNEDMHFIERSYFRYLMGYID